MPDLTPEAERIVREVMKLPDYLGNAYTRKETFERIASALTRTAEAARQEERERSVLRHLKTCASCHCEGDHDCPEARALRQPTPTQDAGSEG